MRSSIATTRGGSGVGGLLLSPVTLASLTALVINDHLLKGRGPGWLTGMLSDAAGAIVLAVLMVVAAELAARRCRRPWMATTCGATIAVLVIVGAVALTKCTQLGNEFGSGALGMFRWPLDLVAAISTGHTASWPRPVAIVRDPWDVLAAIACAVVVWMVHRRQNMIGLEAGGDHGPSSRSTWSL